MSMVTKASHLALALAIAIGGQAAAQQPAFLFRVTLPGGEPAASALVPPTLVSTDAPADFGTGSMANYTVRALVGEPFSLPLATVNGSPPITWGQAPSLPGGIQFADGVIFGTPTAPASQSGQFQASDGQGRTAGASVAFEIAQAQALVYAKRDFLRIGDPFEGRVTSNVRTPTYAIALPPGVTRGAIGATSQMDLAGSVTTAGTYDMGVTVTRPGTSIWAQAPKTVTVAPALTLAFEPPTVPAAIAPVDVAITYGNVAGEASLTLGNAQILSSRGLAYANGRITGMLTAGAAITLTARLSDSADAGRAPTQATLTIPQIGGNGTGTAAIEAGPGRQNAPLPAQIVASFPNPQCTTVEAVPGVTVSASCQVTGAPSQPGTHQLVVDVVPQEDPQAPPVRASATVVVAPPLAAPACSPGVLVPNEPVSLPCGAPSGVTGEPTYELDPTGATPGQLAEVGLSLDTRTGQVTGSPLPGTNLTVKVIVRDSHDGATATGTFQIVTGPPTLTLQASTYRLRGGRSQSFGYATNIPNASISLIGAPPYVSHDAGSGLITITAPAEVAALEPIPSFTVQATSPANGNVFVQAGAINLGNLVPALLLDAPATAQARGNVAFSAPITYSGAVMPSPPFSRGSVPPGLSVGASAIAGTPTTPGTYAFEVVYRDSYDGEEVAKPVSITVAPSLDLEVTAPLTAQNVLAITIGSTKQVTIAPRNAMGTVTIENVAIPGRGLTLASLGLGLPTQGGTLDWAPTQAGAGIANIRMTEVHEGITTVIEKPLEISVTVPQTAAAVLPVGATGGGGAHDAEAAVGALYDVNTAGTTMSLANGQSLLISFAEPVTANGVLIQNVSGLTSVTAEDSGTVVAANVSGTGASAASNGFTATTSRVWRITATAGAVTIGRYQIAYGAAAPTAPSFMTAASYAGQVGVSQTRSVSSSSPGSATGATTWENVGAIPPGMTLNTANGQISGTPDTAGTFVARLRMRVGGTSSAVKSVTFTISP